MPSLAQTLLKLPTRSKIVLGAGALAVVFVLFFMLRLACAPSYTPLVSGARPGRHRQGHRGARRAGHRLRAARQRHRGRRRRRRRSPTRGSRSPSAGVAASSGSAGRLRALRRAEARRLRLPAEGHLPARARGRDRPHDRAGRRRHGRPGAARAPRGLAVRRRGDARHRRGHAHRPVRRARAGRRARHRAAHRLLGEGPQDRPGHDHRRRRHAALAAGRRPPAAPARRAPASRPRRRATSASSRPRSTRCSTQTLGPGKARVQVKADLNVDQTTLRDGEDRRQARAREGDDRDREAQGRRAPPRAAPPAPAGNIPQYSAGAARRRRGLELPAQDGHGREPESRRRSPRRDVAPGAVNRLQVALVVDKSVPPADFAAIQKAVRERGRHRRRSAATSSRPPQLAFAKPPAAPKAGPVPVALLGPLKWVGLGLATLLFMFFMAPQPASKREGEALASPSWLTEIEQPVPLAPLEAPSMAAARRAPDDGPPAAPSRTGQQALDQLMDREPDRVAAQVREVDGGGLMPAPATEPKRPGAYSERRPGAARARRRAPC